MAETRSGYIGRQPGESSVVVATQVFSPTGVQTDFTFAAGYTIGYLDVYLNGVRQINANDYYATDGTTVTFPTNQPVAGDTVECLAYKAFDVGNVSVPVFVIVEITGAVNVLFSNVCAPVRVATVESIATVIVSVAAASVVTPVPPVTVKVSAFVIDCDVPESPETVKDAIPEPVARTSVVPK